MFKKHEDTTSGMGMINNSGTVFSAASSIDLPSEYEEKFKLVFEHAPLGIALIDPSWKIIDANQKLCELLGYSAEELIGTDIRQITYSEDLGPTFQFMKKVQGGVINSYEIRKRYIKRSGELLAVLIHSAVIRNQNGDLLYSVLMVQDLSLEEKQNKELKLLGHSVNSISEMITITDKEDKFIFVNKAFLIRYGYKEEEILGKNPRVLSPEPAQYIVKIIGDVRWKGELVNRTKKGDLFPIYLETSVVKNDRGEPIGFIGVAKDITEQKKTEEHIRKLSKAVEQNPAAIIITDKEGKVEYVNPKFIDITGYKPEEVIGRTPRILKSGNKTKAEYETLWNTILSGNEWTGDFINKKKSGDVFHEHAIISPIKNGLGEITHFVAVKEDVTAQKEAEEKMKRSESFAALGRMTSYLSHEIRTPLTAIKLNIDMLMEQMRENTCCDQSFQIINKELKRLENLLKDVLQYSKKRVEIYGAISADSILKQVTQLMQPVFEGKNISIINKISHDLVKGDPDELKTMFMQLIENSVDAIGQDGEIEFLSVIDAKKKMHRIFMRDTGCGVKPVKNIFEPFYTTKRTGTGLGLSIVQQIIEKHNGTIFLIFSEPGNTIFQLSLPLV